MFIACIFGFDFRWYRCYNTLHKSGKIHERRIFFFMLFWLYFFPVSDFILCSRICWYSCTHQVSFLYFLSILHTAIQTAIFMIITIRLSFWNTVISMVKHVLHQLDMAYTCPRRKLPKRVCNYMSLDNFLSMWRYICTKWNGKLFVSFFFRIVRLWFGILMVFVYIIINNYVNQILFISDIDMF